MILHLLLLLLFLLFLLLLLWPDALPGRLRVGLHLHQVLNRVGCQNWSAVQDGVVYHLKVVGQGRPKGLCEAKTSDDACQRGGRAEDVQRHCSAQRTLQKDRSGIFGLVTPGSIFHDRSAVE